MGRRGRSRGSSRANAARGDLPGPLRRGGRRLAILLLIPLLFASGCHHVLVPIEYVCGVSIPASEPPPALICAREIHAHHVQARLIYAEHVPAPRGRVGAIVRWTAEGRDWGRTELRTRTVVALQIQAKEIHTDWIEADQIYARDVQIGE